jgi:mannose-1-phosphate guanylyltransferase
MAHAMVLCAGLGTRLRPLTDELPKPLVPIGDASLLEHIAARLATHGLDELVVNTHHLIDVFISAISSLPLKVEVVPEQEIRGTAGGVAGARRHLEAPALIWNGDILADPPVAELLERARAVAQVVLCVAPRLAGEGTVGIGANQELVRIRGESFGREVQGGDYVGIAALGADWLARLPEKGCLVGDVLLPALRGGQGVATAELRGTWTDVGDVAAYLAENRAWLAKRGASSFVGDGASIRGEVQLRDSVIGRAASVGGSGALERCVIWPGASAHAPLADCVVTTSGRVVRP